jgi:putative ABC transport system permease protein
MPRLPHDVRHAARSLRRSRELAWSVVLALAVGAGAGVPFLALARSGLAVPPFAAAARHSAAPAAEVLLRPTAGMVTIAAAQDAGLGTLLRTLAGLALLVLAVAGVNVAILLMARASARRRENAVRAAIGAAPSRLARLLGAEGAMLAGAGAAGALAVLGACAWLLAGTWPREMPRTLRLGLGSPGAWVPLAALCAGCLAFCVAPALGAGRRNLRAALGAGTHATAGRAEGRLRDALAVLALAASVALAASAGLLAKAGAAEAAGARTGMDARNTLTARVELGGARWSDPARRASAYAGLLARLPAGAEARAESVSSVGAWRGMGAEDRVRVVCGQCSRGNMMLPIIDGTARYHAVSPGFFRSLGAELVAGRELAATDAAGAAAVAVIDESFAYQLFPNGSPLGKRVRLGGEGGRWRDETGQWVRVVGIVRGVRAPGIGNPSVPVPSIYLSAMQFPPRVVGLAVRTPGDPLRAVPAVRRTVAASIPGARVGEWGTLERHLRDSVEPLRWFGLLFRAMAACALLLAVTGLYGTVSYGVARRTREIGLRMALGATGAAVARWVAGRALRLARTGALLGLGAALCLARMLQLSFAGVPLYDGRVYGGIVALLAAVALAAGIRPAMRAVRVDPTVALRSD